jgi:hypothetical protein
MTVKDEILQKVTRLPPERQREVLEFVDSLHDAGPKAAAPKRNTYCGALVGQIPDITAEEIDELRHEMWRNFPRDDVV